MAPEPPDAATETEPCPACGTALPVTARLCFSCRQDLTSHRAALRALDLADETRADAAEGRFRPVPPEVFRRLRRRTVYSGLFLFPAALMVVPSYFEQHGLNIVLAVLGIGLGIVPLLLFVVFGIQDLLLLPPERLTTPDAAFRTYVKCLREKRWEYAWHLVVPRGLAGIRVRPSLPGARGDAGLFTLETPGGLAAFWSPMLHTSGWYSRWGTVERPQGALAGGESAM